MTCDAIGCIVAVLRRDYGDYGYRFERFEQVGWTGGARGFVAHSDGSRFVLVSDRYGNVKREEEA